MVNKKQLGKKIVVSLSIITSILLLPSLVHAELNIREINREIKKEVIKGENIKKEIMQDKKIEMKEGSKNLLERAKDMVKEKIKRQIKGTLVSVTGSVLMVQNDKTTYTVNTTEKTELKRKFGANSQLSEFSPNDMLLIIGKRKENSDGTLSSTEIEASYIRNMSIQRRFVVFTGTVTAKSDNTITLKTIGRGIQTIYVSGTTKYSEKNKAITLSNISIGNKIIVKGELWDRINDKVDAKSILKLSLKGDITPLPTSKAK